MSVCRATSVVGVAMKTTPLWDGEDLAGWVGLLALPLFLCPVALSSLCDCLLLSHCHLLSALYLLCLCFLLPVPISAAVSLAVSCFYIVRYTLISYSTGAYKGTSLDLWVGGTAPSGWEKAWGCRWLSLPAGLMPAVQMWMNVAWAWRDVTHGQPA